MTTTARSFKKSINAAMRLLNIAKGKRLNKHQRDRMNHHISNAQNSSMPVACRPRKGIQ
jgi:hypothetical protein